MSDVLAPPVNPPSREPEERLRVRGLLIDDEEAQISEDGIDARFVRDELSVAVSFPDVSEIDTRHLQHFTPHLLNGDIRPFRPEIREAHGFSLGEWRPSITVGFIFEPIKTPIRGAHARRALRSDLFLRQTAFQPLARITPAQFDQAVVSNSHAQTILAAGREFMTRHLDYGFTLMPGYFEGDEPVALDIDPRSAQATKVGDGEAVREHLMLATQQALGEYFVEHDLPGIFSGFSTKPHLTVGAWQALCARLGRDDKDVSMRDVMMTRPAARFFSAEPQLCTLMQAPMIRFKGLRSLDGYHNAAVLAAHLKGELNDSTVRTALAEQAERFANLEAYQLRRRQNHRDLSLLGTHGSLERPSPPRPPHSQSAS